MRQLGSRQRTRVVGWQRFVVAEADRQLVGAVQLRHHPDGSRELGSLVVAAPWRGRGIAARMIERLLAEPSGPVHMITGATHAPRSVRLNHLMGWLAGVMSRQRGRQPRELVILERSAKQSV